MMTRKSYKAFTFVEMLIVMGILIILMVIGIAAGRYAINRANRVAHQNAADQLYQTLQAYYTEHRQFPEKDSIQNMLTGSGDEESDGALYPYTEGDLKGGSPATYTYFTQGGLGGVRQAVLVCVTLGGYDDELGRGIYCTGNGFQDDKVVIGTMNAQGFSTDFVDVDNEYYDAIKDDEQTSDWNGNGWGKDQTTP